jgi:hypothetical protein
LSVVILGPLTSGLSPLKGARGLPENGLDGASYEALHISRVTSQRGTHCVRSMAPEVVMAKGVDGSC